MTTDVAAEKKCSSNKLTVVGLGIAAVLVCTVEMNLSAYVQAWLFEFANKGLKVGPEIQLVILNAGLLLTMMAFALLNPLVLTKLAGKKREILARGFAISSVVWLMSGLLVAFETISAMFSGNAYVVTLVVAAIYIIAAIVQAILSMRVIKQSASHP